MLQKADKLPDGHRISCDVCVVGAGAAGTVLAHELGQKGLSVVLLEAGDLKGEAGSQKLYEGETLNSAFHLPPDRDRTRGLGGSTSMWGGRCMPYDPIDFEPRAHVPHSGWPLSRALLEPYYARAQTYADCGTYDYDSTSSGLDGELIKGFDSPALQTSSLERWSPPTHFGKLLKDKLGASPNVTVLTGAVATDLERAGGHIAAVIVKTLKGGRSLRIDAKDIILAGGGLETTRLLLATAKDGQPAIGDHSGWLGRGYMTHVGGVISRLKFREGQEIIFGYESDADGVYVRRRFTLSAEAQREHGLLNLYALLDRPLVGDASHNNAVLSFLYLAKNLLQRQSKGGETGSGKFALYKQHIRNILFGAPEVLTVLPKFGRERFLQGRRIPSLLLSSKDNTFYLYFHSEQAPNRESRVYLGPKRDFLGMPRLVIDARITDDDVAAIRRAHELIGQELKDAGVGELEFLSEDVEEAIRACKCTLGHHIGTTRMADDPAEGVVDADLRVHGVDNLYVASSSAFPTASQAHPTLTILALSLRLADQLAVKTPAEAEAALA